MTIKSENIVLLQSLGRLNRGASAQGYSKINPIESSEVVKLLNLRLGGDEDVEDLTSCLPKQLKY